MKKFILAITLVLLTGFLNQPVYASSFHLGRTLLIHKIIKKLKDEKKSKDDDSDSSNGQ